MEVRKTDQNTPITDINTITNPNTKTLIDRYVFASNFVKGQSVLDCPSGHGYGTMILHALGAKQVFGVDIDEDALQEAADRYHTKEKETAITFGFDDMTKPWLFKSGLPGYDCVVSIEGFEHVPREAVPQMLTNFKTATKSGGTIIISTPRRKMPVWDFKGGVHFYEYDLNEFYEELTKVFNDIQIYYAVEFRHPASNELNTVFTQDPEWADKCAVFMAVIKND